MHPPLDHLNYRQVADLVNARLRQDAQGNMASRQMLPVVTAEWAAHKPEVHEVGQPCAHCGAVWPCSAIKYILTYD